MSICNNEVCSLGMGAPACWFKGELYSIGPGRFEQSLVWQCNPSYDTVLSKQISRFNKDRNSSPDCNRTKSGLGAML